MNDQTPEQTPAELRAAADRGRKLERENAFLKAGINVDDPRMSYFVEGYKGDLTKDAIVAEATAAGFLQQATPEPEPKTETEPEPEPKPERREATDEEREFDAMNDVGAGSAPAGTQQEADELEIGWEKFAERRKAGDRLEDASSEVIGRVMAGAIEGDKRFIV